MNLGKIALPAVSIGVTLATVVACGGNDTKDSTAGSSTASSSASASSTSTAPPPPPTVNADALPKILPTLDELKTIMNNPGLIAGPNSTGVEAPNPSEQSYDPADCASSFTAAAPPAYDGSGYKTLLGFSQAQSPTPSVMLGESVALFDTAAAAQTALANYLEQWRRCAGKQFTWTVWQQKQKSAWTLGAPEDAGGGVTSLQNTNPGSPVSVTRAIAAKNNVLVDVQIMGSNLADQNVSIAKRILDRIPG
jgi:eukaryotic-like serine/threonine-protein kinase